MDPRVGKPPLTGNSRKASELAFYEKSTRILTSADIINEAKLSLRHGTYKTRTVLDTKRPETAARNTRELVIMKRRSSDEKAIRPLSALSINSAHSDETNHRSADTMSDVMSDDGLQRSQSEFSLKESLSAVNRYRAARLRPLSTAPTSLRCDAAQTKLQRDILLEEHADGFFKEPLQAHTQLERPTSQAKSSVTESSGYCSRVSSAASQPNGDASSDSESLVFDVDISPHLAALASDNCVDMMAELHALFVALQKHDILVKKTKLRARVLKLLFKLADETRPKLCIGIVNIILQMNISGANLVNIVQRIYVLSKRTENDQLFDNKTFLENFLKIMTADTQSLSNDTMQIVLFALGSLKFWSTNKDIRLKLCDLDVGSFLAEAINVVMMKNTEPDVVTSVPMETTKATHILLQISGILRNLLDGGKVGRCQLLKHDIYARLIQLIGEIPQRMTSNVKNTEERELVLNISRIFSLSSLYEDSMEKISAEPQFVYNMYKLLERYYKRQDISVRFLFTLGNLLSWSDQLQWNVFQQAGFLQLLIRQLQFYVDQDKHLCGDISETESVCSSASSQKTAALTEDLLIKLVRVFANLSAHPDVGDQLCTNADLVNLLLVVLEYKQIFENEELVINCLVTLNNLSFCSSTQSIFNTHSLEITEKVAKYIGSQNSKGVAEAYAVLGNLSRDEKVQQYLCRRKSHIDIARSLAWDSIEVVLGALGILINLCCLSEVSKDLLQHRMAEKLLIVLNGMGANFVLGTRVCQMLWNIFSHYQLTLSLKLDIVQSYVDCLLPLTDDDGCTFPPEMPDDMQEQLRLVWQDEFCPTAITLLEKFAELQTIRQ